MKKPWLKEGKIARKTDIARLVRLRGPEKKNVRSKLIEWTFYGLVDDQSSRKWLLTYDIRERRFRAVAAWLDDQENKYFAHMGDLFPITWHEIPAKRPKTITALLRQFMPDSQIAEALALSIKLGARK